MFKKILSGLLVFSIIFFLLFKIIQNSNLIFSYSFKFSLLDLTLILILMLLIYPLNAFSWYLVIKSLNVKLKYLTSLKIWIFSNIGRFIPGVIWQYLGRVYLASLEGVAKTEANASLILEALFGLLAGVIILITSTLFNANIKIIDSKFLLLLLVLLVVILILLSNQNILSLLLNKLSKVTKKLEALGKIHFSVRWIPLILTSFFAQFIIDGTILFLLSKDVASLSINQLPLFIGFFTASWMIGYLTIIAPAGLGVQEVSIAALLSLFMPFPVASLIAILFRVVLLIAELITFIGMIILVKVNLIEVKK